MTVKRTLKLIHLTGTLCFIASVAYILILALRQADVSWWVIFSLSGHTALAGFIIISIYLFAMFRGVGDSPRAVEHPLTKSNYYMLFYVSSPYLGLAAGCIGMFGSGDSRSFFLGVSLGVFGTTFFVWVILDLIIGLIEYMLPASRAGRGERDAKIAAERMEKDLARQQLLQKVMAKEKLNRKKWEDELAIDADKLASLLLEQRDDRQAEYLAVGIGVKAWQLGGLSCMKFLHEMTLQLSLEQSGTEETQFVDTISIWWDGIGRWSNPSIT